MIIRAISVVESRIRNLGTVDLEEILRLKNIEEKYGKLDSLSPLPSFAKSIEFLKLKPDWMTATIMLQVQEVATVSVAYQQGTFRTKFPILALLEDNVGVEHCEME